LELLLENPKYKTQALGEFSTFGWCSRKRNGICIVIRNFKYTGRVYSDGNHSWSEFNSLQNNKNKTITFSARIDNTFDEIEWTTISENKINS
jgi:hypothetical protein